MRLDVSCHLPHRERGAAAFEGKGKRRSIDGVGRRAVTGVVAVEQIRGALNKDVVGSEPRAL